MFRKHLKQIATVCGATILILFSLSYPRPQQKGQTPNPKVTETLQSTRGGNSKSTQTRPLENFTPFQNTDFCRIIIANNLFRPLGWKPPRPRRPYRLLGTIIPTDGNEVFPQAIVQATLGSKTHIVTIGEKLDKDTTVTDIQHTQVTLQKEGQRTTLTLQPGFLRRR